MKNKGYTEFWGANEVHYGTSASGELELHQKRRNTVMYMLWFKFILGLNFIFFCFKIIIIHYHTQKQKKIKFKPRMKLNHNIYTVKDHHTNTRKIS